MNLLSVAYVIYKRWCDAIEGGNDAARALNGMR